MIVIDGSRGEGGGQILRSALALSLVTGLPFRIDKIRAGRRKPGLMRQHLTAVEAAAAVGRAKAEGAGIGSQRLAFAPKVIRSGKYLFAVGTAGSCTLVLQTVLPALLTAEGPSELVLEGGTHNPHAPPFDFLDRAFLPLVRRMGPKVSASLQRPGFFPAGGGRFTVAIEPAARLERIDLPERGAVLECSATATVARLPRSIGERELKVVRDRLGWSGECCHVNEASLSPGPGNILCIGIESEHCAEVFTGFGELGVSAEKVAKDTVKLVEEYLTANVPVGPFLADQLLLPMALAGGGSFRTLEPTRHMTTNAEVIRLFLPIEVDMRQLAPNDWEIRVERK
ncbi:MAG TPA: RNA 3'-terminal phosphate cyclase [Geobacteraceae bacterium]|nr:RNA 3'-terminal phosphate cyclase [Geobacteraceae bacterium]